MVHMTELPWAVSICRTHDSHGWQRRIIIARMENDDRNLSITRSLWQEFVHSFTYEIQGLPLLISVLRTTAD